MVYFNDEVIISLIIGSISIILELYLSYKILQGYIRKERPYTILLLLLSIIIKLIGDLIFFSSLFIASTSVSTAVNSIKIQYIFYILFNYFIYLFSEEFENRSRSTNRQMIITILATILNVFIILIDIEPFYYSRANINLDTGDFLMSMFVLILIGTLGVSIISSFIRGYKNSWITQKKQIKILISGFCLVFVFPLLISIVFELLFEDPLLILNKAVVKFIELCGVFILYLSFQGFRYSSLFYRQKAERLIVTNLTGLPLFVFDFKEEIQHIDTLLFSGAIVAISQLMFESLKSATTISEVVMKNKYKLMLDFRENFLVIIFTPKGNNYLREGLSLFSTAFEKNFDSDIVSGNTFNISVFTKEGKNLLCNCFGIPWKELLTDKKPK